MQDWPGPEEILDALADALRGEPMTRFEARVAAAAADIARRELAAPPETEAAERAAIAGHLGADPDLPLADLIRQLSDAIREGRLGEETPGLLNLLWQVTLAKVAVDQPGFALYRRLIAEEAPDEPQP